MDVEVQGGWNGGEVRVETSVRDRRQFKCSGSACSCCERLCFSLSLLRGWFCAVDAKMIEEEPLPNRHLHRTTNPIGRSVQMTMSTSSKSICVF